MNTTRGRHEHTWHEGQIHHNWKFGRKTPRTLREAFGEESPPHRRDWDWLVVLVCVVGGVVALWLIPGSAPCALAANAMIQAWA